MTKTGRLMEERVLMSHKCHQSQGSDQRQQKVTETPGQGIRGPQRINSDARNKLHPLNYLPLRSQTHSILLALSPQYIHSCQTLICEIKNETSVHSTRAVKRLIKCAALLEFPLLGINTLPAFCNVLLCLVKSQRGDNWFVAPDLCPPL